MRDIKEKLLNKIKSGEISMTPKWHFVLRASLWATTAVIVAMIAVYLLSFIIYALHRTGVLFAPLYGLRGLNLFLISSPWVLILLVGIFLLILYVLVSQYAFSYKKPLVYSMLGVVLAVIGFASFIQYTSLHDQLSSFVERHPVPGIAPMYQTFAGTRPDDIAVGVVTDVSEEGFILEALEGDEFMVRVSSTTHIPRFYEIKTDDRVAVFGTKEEEIIDAFGVRPADDRILGGKGRGFGPGPKSH